MSLSDFKAFRLAKELYHVCEKLRVPLHLKEQLSRSSSSIALNLAEGSSRRTFKDQNRFYYIAYSSATETEANLLLANVTDPKVLDLADHVCRILNRLVNRKPPS